MTKFSQMILLVALGCLLGMTWVGCGGQEETAQDAEVPAARTEKLRPEYDAPPTLDGMPPIASETAVTIQEELKVKQELPDYYPEDGPLYPDTLPSSIRAQGSKVTLGFGTNDSTAEVASYMESDLKSKGWTVLPVQEMPTGTLIQGTKDGRNATVLVAGLNGGSDGHSTMIMVSVQR